ncbi:MAG TPA: DUF4105 domain-containing protein [Longimicrobiales bacterium]|nr:DUF4105 domain-containing protein [Longimicrobiales bacterium]
MRRTLAGIGGTIVLGGMIGWTSIRPAHDRAWIPEQRLLPFAEITGDTVTIHNMRNFRWGPGADVREAWDTRTYDSRELESVWYVLTPFSRDWRGPAHAFVSFGFRDGRHVAISVEARREQGEAYSMVRGALKRFEIMYVIGDERDLIQLRASRGDDVYVYPIRASTTQIVSMFTAMIERANGLRAEPEFYGTLRNNCTTNVLDHVNSIATRRIRFGRKVLLPGYSDQLAWERGLIDTELTLEQARARFRINERAARYADDDDYSRRIRAAE